MEDLQPGDRVVLEHTSDPHTKLVPGSEGTFKRYFDNMGDQELWIDWDSGSKLSLIPATGDRVRKL